MANWAHLEINVDDEGNVEVGAYNAEYADVVDGPDSWEDLLAAVGAAGWEMVQIVPGAVNSYWFKKQV